MSPALRATAIGSVAVALWSSLAVLTVLAGPIPPFQLVAMTFAIGGAAGLVAVALRGSRVWQPVPIGAWALSVAGLFGYHALYFAAFALAPAVEVNLVNYLWPLLIVLFAGLIGGLRLHARHLAGAALGFGGCVLAIGSGAGFALDNLAGYLCALGAAFTWAIYSVLNRRFGTVPSDAVAGFCIATALLAVPAHLAFETTVRPDAGTLALVLAMGLGPVGLAFYAWDHGTKHGDLRLLGVLSYLTPVLSTLWLVLAGRAPLAPTLLIACALVAGGALLAARTR
ncbi:aromatic amino acid exporter YddG [Elioraea rosea]|uniref:aromatic amino acid exporter YddG n=1 Tax=Elioraea rosea TaxID=2492390 RepID=UPI001185E878|nr:EamA family transporter [Elioraea rosea]